MIQYIPKAAVVAEIERLKVHSKEAIHEFGREGYIDNVLFEQSKMRICETLLSFINTLEVKEVDLDKEYVKNICLLYEQVYKEFWDEHDSLDDVYEEVLKRLKAQKGE